MRSFIAFLKKELLESARGGKLLLLAGLFAAFGIMNPAIAKLTPWLVEMLSEDLAESGMVVTGVTVDAITSWTQFFKNIPMALIAFVLIYGGTFPKEYASGSLILVLTKGLSRYKVVLAKTVTMLFLWTAGYWLCFGITYGYNAYFWDNSIATGLMPAVVGWWVFGAFVIAVVVFFSVAANSYSGVLLGTGASVLGLYLLSFLPKLTLYMPTALMGGTALMADTGEIGKALTVAVLLSLACIGTSILIFNKKQI